MEIRNAEKNDVPIIYEMGSETEEFDVTDNEEIFWDKDSLDSWFDNQKDICLVAEENDQIVGFILSHIHIPTGKVEIENIFVEEAYRGQGVASELFQNLLNDYESGDAEFGVEITMEDNTKIHEFNRKMGFRRGSNVIWWDYEF